MAGRSFLLEPNQNFASLGAEGKAPEAEWETVTNEIFSGTFGIGLPSSF